MPGPLQGVRILDLTSVVLGPLATQVMGDLGADVIKIESPQGDTTRHTGPKRSSAMAALFMGLNRNKRSIVLDLKQEPARNALWKLIENADVFLHSIRQSAVARLGFPPDAVLARNPRIIYGAIQGFRSDGTYAGAPAYDDVIQGLSGCVDLMTRIVGEPRYMPTIMVDKTCGLVVSYAVMAALFERERSGIGQAIEIPMFETMVAFNMADHLFGHAFDPPEGPMGYSRVLTPARRPYPTQDGFLCMLAYTDDQWRRFWNVVEHPEYANDRRFDSLASRAENIEEVYSLASTFIARQTTDHWLEVLGGLDIPCAQATPIDELVEDPHLKSVDFFRTEDHPTEGAIRVTDTPVRFSRTPAEINHLQPGLGEHSVDILREAGLSEAEIGDMLDRGATA